ncbi:DUF1127 domain-containing protein [Thalassospira sp. HF15]|uniref:DUF1127 domain-containing protein n=1 Tax=Thalassospira sp. HF15 TaxID=2722755 RepID=UPI00142FF1EF|nr:DUF1127 domain-containing protein [Thalassospira sp. HF15]NIY74568.1 DUF1127 domain-containing protein [Thalassospira sp. HF15]
MVNCNDAIQIPNIHGDDRATTNGKQGVKLASWRAAITGVVISAVEYLALRQARARDLYALQNLDDQMLKDIGVTRADIDQELAKPFLLDFPRRG